MNPGLRGARIAILVARGSDDLQIAQVCQSLGDAGANVELVAAAMPADRGRATDTLSLEEVSASSYVGMVVPGGEAGAQVMAADPRAVQFAREMMLADKPVAVIGEGLALLVAADAVGGRTVAGAPAMRAAVQAQGGTFVDAPLYDDERLITSRGATDLSHLLKRLGHEFDERITESRLDQLSEASFPASDPPPGPSAVGGHGASRSTSVNEAPEARRPSRN